MLNIKYGSLITVGIATWISAMLTGQFIVLLTNIPASSAILTGFIVPFLLIFGAKVVNHKWSITIAFVTYGIIAIPTVLLGPPGIHKVFIALLGGIVADITIQLLKPLFKHLSYSIAMSLWGLTLALLTWLAFSFIDLPGKEMFMKAFPILTVIFTVTAFIGAYVSSITFDKMNITNSNLYKRIHNK